jgi:CheY-like chemotaxis protein
MTAPFKVLVAEDSEEDRLLMTHSLSRIPSFQLVGELEHDHEVRAYLQGKGIYADRHLYPLPDLLLHDAMMYGENAIEFLNWLKLHPVPGLIVIIFTGSIHPSACIEFVKNGAHACYTKPGDLLVLESYLHEIESNLLNGHYHQTQNSRFASIAH